MCDRCLEKTPPFTGVTALGRYEGLLLDLVIRIKYRREERIAGLLGDLLGRKLREQRPQERHPQERHPEVDWILPVPLHPRRLRRREFNQAAWLGRALGRVLKIPCDPLNLVKIRETPTQTALDLEARKRNLRHSFALRWPERIAGRKVLLVDDVMTTGATVGLCAELLKKGGAKEVQVAVVARTP